MILKLRYLLITLLLTVALQAAGQPYVIDQVCAGAVRKYRIEGEMGSAYQWFLTNQTGGILSLSNSQGTPINYTNAAGNVVFGNEISIPWTLSGAYQLQVIQNSVLGCDTLEQGTVVVFDQPIALAGNPLSICAETQVELFSAQASNYSSLLWIASGDGKFDNPLALHPIYYFGPLDKVKGNVKLSLIAYGKGNDNTCSPDTSTISVAFIAIPKLVITDPPSVCLPKTIDLSQASVTQGSDPTLTYEYFTDFQGTQKLVNYKAVDKSGTYYIKGSNSIGCQVFKPVKVIFDKQIIPSFASIPEICLNSPSPPPLPPSSFNGITGKWSPVVISTAAVGNFPYKFTPDAGQCARDTVIVVKVSRGITPVFSFNDLCVGSDPFVLPLFSDNGIQGSWNPKAITPTLVGNVTAIFTPEAGGCGVSVPVSIRVIDRKPTQFSKYRAITLCQGSIPPELPTSDDNGISGTWNPATISTALSKVTIYNFTPFNGECARGFSAVVTVNSEQEPEFNPIGPICWGSTLAPLPTTSKNGITGTWSMIQYSEKYVGTFTPDANMCADSTSMTIRILDPVDVLISADPLLVYGGTTQITVSATGGSGTYISGTGTFNGGAGWHKYTVTDNAGCTGLDSIFIKNPMDLIVTAKLLNPITCPGGFGLVQVQVTGGTKPYKYSFIGGNPASFSSGNDSTFAVYASDIPYEFEVFDQKGLYGQSDPLLITEPPGLSLSAQVKSPTCRNGSDGTATVVTTDANGAVTYLWNDALQQNSATATGLKVGQYLVTVKDNCGSKTLTVTVPEPPAITLAALGIENICAGFDGSIEFQFVNIPDGIYDISYDGGVFPAVKVTGSRASVAAAVGTYTNLKLLINGCSTADGVVAQVKNNSQLTIRQFFILQPSCKTNTPTGTVVITDPSQNAKFIYRIDNGPYQSSSTFTGILPGTHQLQIKEVTLGCESDQKDIIIKQSEPLPLSPEVEIKQPDCAIAFGTILVTTPISGSTYTLRGTDPATAFTTNTTGVFANLAPGTYELVETNAAGCNSIAATYIINTPPNALTAPTAIPVPPECDRPGLVLYARTGIATQPAGTILKWYDELGNPVNNPFLDQPGSVTFFAESSFGNCPVSPRTAVTLTILSSPEILVKRNPVEECVAIPLQTLNANDYVSVQAGISLIWYDAAVGGNKIASPVINAVGSKTYYAETFNGQCPSAGRTSITLTIYPLPPAPQASVKTAPSCTNEHGVIEITSPLGPQYEYSIDGGAYQASVLFTELSSKAYSLQAKNIKTGCISVPGKIILPDVPPEPIMKSAIATNCLCYGGDGSIDFIFENVSDGTYVIVYLGGEFLNVQVMNNLATVIAKAGTYTILAIQANGCTSKEYNKSVIISEPDQLSVSAKITEIDLKSGQRGEIDLTITGGSSKYLPVWEPNLQSGFTGATTEDLFNLNDGDYVVTVTDQNNCSKTLTLTIPFANLPPIATNDAFKAGCGGVSGDLMFTDNGNGIDYDPDNDTISIDTAAVQKPAFGHVTINMDGTFEYHANQGYTGTDQFKYQIFDVKKNFSIPATVTIQIVSDFDCDGFADDLDNDADGDGILNVDEGGKLEDTDGDGHPNWLDIDDDNDGIVDNIEAQPYLTGYIPPSGKHSDSDGLDDAYDPDLGNSHLKPIDTDSDGIPDFLDSDSDNDLVPDYIEGHDGNDADGVPENVLVGKDADADGLDDSFDTVDRYKSPIENMTGSNAPLQDFDGDGKHDWRDDNDDDDQYPTRFEDLNADNDFSNDDTDTDGHPEYLDFGRDCDMFIPDAFSPNDDNVHEYFQIYCIDHFPDAKMYIFDQLGNLLFEKEHYGNLSVWDTPDRAWWDGRTKNRSATVIDGKVTPGTYFYVLKLGNGEVKKSFVFVSY